MKVALKWWPDSGPCGKCGTCVKKLIGHIGRFPACAGYYFEPFWYNVVHNWDELPVIDRNTTALQWWTSQPDLCVCDWTSPGVVGNHLRLRTGQSCLEGIVAMFEVWINGGGRPALHLGLEVVWRRG